MEKIQPDDVGMVEISEKFDLSFDFGAHIAIFHALFINDFDGNIISS